MQNLLWIPQKNILLLIQNQLEGRRWRFTFLDLPQSIKMGHEVVLKTVETDKADELEGFTLLGATGTGVAVSSARRDNVVLMDVSW